MFCCGSWLLLFVGKLFLFLLHCLFLIMNHCSSILVIISGCHSSYCIFSEMLLFLCCCCQIVFLFLHQMVSSLFVSCCFPCFSLWLHSDFIGFVIDVYYCLSGVWVLFGVFLLFLFCCYWLVFVSSKYFVSFLFFGASLLCC